MVRDEATKQILEAKQAKGLTWEEIATSVGRHAVWTTAAQFCSPAVCNSEMVITSRGFGSASRSCRSSCL